jgi:hypothetical protein
MSDERISDKPVSKQFENSDNAQKKRPDSNVFFGQKPHHEEYIDKTKKNDSKAIEKRIRSPLI